MSDLGMRASAAGCAEFDLGQFSVGHRRVSAQQSEWLRADEFLSTAKTSRRAELWADVHSERAGDFMPVKDDAAPSRVIAYLRGLKDAPDTWPEVFEIIVGQEVPWDGEYDWIRFIEIRNMGHWTDVWHPMWGAEIQCENSGRCGSAEAETIKEAVLKATALLLEHWPIEVA